MTESLTNRKIAKFSQKIVSRYYLNINFFFFSIKIIMYTESWDSTSKIIWSYRSIYLRWSNIGKYFLVELLMIEAWCSAIFGKIFVVHPVIKRIRGRNSPSWLEDGENRKRECRADDKSNKFLASAPRIESVSITCVWWNLITWNYIKATRSHSNEIWGSFAFTDYSHSLLVRDTFS